MQSFDIPVNFKVNCNSEEEAEAAVEALLKHQFDQVPVLQRTVYEWDFVEFLTEEEFDDTDLAGV